MHLKTCWETIEMSHTSEDQNDLNQLKQALSHARRKHTRTAGCDREIPKRTDRRHWHGLSFSRGFKFTRGVLAFVGKRYRCHFRGAPRPMEYRSVICNSDPAAAGKMNSRWGGFIDQIDQFDPNFFGISLAKHPKWILNNVWSWKLHGKRWKMQG